MNWQSIDTAPKDGTEIALWCKNADLLLLKCKWEKNMWRTWEIDGFDGMDWCKLEVYELPTHWMKIVPPEKEVDGI